LQITANAKFLWDVQLSALTSTSEVDYDDFILPRRNSINAHRC